MNSKLRLDIQALRCLAVMSVVIYHIWPQALPGGYVGVDVFFVISGFLITSHLLRELRSTGRINYRQYFARRIRRLVPAATFVLVCVAIALPILPAARHEATSMEILASALYFQNWWLSSLSIDYLASEAVPSPLQHYWSLSIEEQFYFIWPFLIYGSVYLVRGRRSFRGQRGALYAVAIVLLLSLLLSVIYTYTSPEQAYFLTYTRAWELALGALVAFLPSSTGRGVFTRTLSALGLLMILLSVVFFSKETAFPGYIALLPTIGTALVILNCRFAIETGAFKIMKTRVVQFLGDHSYSLYLWHWPLIVFFTARSGVNISLINGACLILFTVGLSYLSKRFIEDYFRNKWSLEAQWLKSLGLAFGSILLCLSISGWIHSRVEASEDAHNLSALDEEIYPGGRVLTHGAIAPENIAPMPPSLVAKRDLPSVYHSGCHKERDIVVADPCVFGREEAQVHLALVGDSHAAQWVPALERIVVDNNWKVTIFTKSGCPLLVATIRLRDTPYTECLKWGESVFQQLAKLKPDIILQAHTTKYELFPTRGAHKESLSMKEAVRLTWDKLKTTGAQLAILEDTPRLLRDPADCLDSPETCKVASESAQSNPDLLAQMASKDPNVQLIRMNEFICTSDLCESVIGNTVVWRDPHHLTATYARSLASALFGRISPLLKPNKLIGKSAD